MLPALLTPTLIAILAHLLTAASAAATIGPPDPWSWSLSTSIAAAALILVVIAHTTAAFVFFFKWKTSLDLVRHDLDSFKLEIREDLRKIEFTLERMAANQVEIVELRGELGIMRERMRNIESGRRADQERRMEGGWHAGTEEEGDPGRSKGRR